MPVTYSPKAFLGQNLGDQDNFCCGKGHYGAVFAQLRCLYRIVLKFWDTKNDKFSICSKWKIDHFYMSRNLEHLKYQAEDSLETSSLIFSETQ